MERVILSGSEALAETALRAGARFFAGYPITPGTELLEYLAAHMSQRGGVCIQASSELEAINMVCGAAATGERAMTATSGPGIDLMQEGIDNMVAQEMPAVVIDLGRVGPGNTILPYQGDYWLLTRGGGHGGYHMVVYAPATVQEAVDLCYLSFEIADRYRHPVAILGDVILANTSETVMLPEQLARDQLPVKSWAIGGARGRPPNKIYDGSGIGRVEGTKSYEVGEGMGAEASEQVILHLIDKYRRLVESEGRVEVDGVEDCQVCVAAFGTMARFAKTAMRDARRAGLKVGLLRPITIWPFPNAAVHRVASRGIPILSVEMNFGQMAQDIERAARGMAPVHFYGRYGGVVPGVDEIREAIERVAAGQTLPLPVGD